MQNDDRVKAHTARAVNERIDRHTDERILHAGGDSPTHALRGDFDQSTRTDREKPIERARSAWQAANA